MDLVTFLLDRFGEDEVEINQHPIDDGEPLDESLEPQGLRAEVGADWPYAKWLRIGKARALREVEAKRRIVAMYEDAATEGQALLNRRVHGATVMAATASVGAFYLVLQELALPYADHPDYDPEWKP